MQKPIRNPLSHQINHCLNQHIFCTDYVDEVYQSTNKVINITIDAILPQQNLSEPVTLSEMDQVILSVSGRAFTAIAEYMPAIKQK